MTAQQTSCSAASRGGYFEGRNCAANSGGFTFRPRFATACFPPCSRSFSWGSARIACGSRSRRHPSKAAPEDQLPDMKALVRLLLADNDHDPVSVSELLFSVALGVLPSVVYVWWLTRTRGSLATIVLSAFALLGPAGAI